MKSLFKRSIAVALALVLVLGMLWVPAAAADEGVTVKLHYNRPDGDYTGWSVWFWCTGAEGTDVPFENVNGEMVATFCVPDGATSIGYIVKLPDWAAKDVDKDQFIDVTAYVSGTVHAYVESGKEGCEIKLGDDIVSGLKVASVQYKEDKGIVVSMTGKVDPAAFAVMGPNGVVACTASETATNTYTLVPGEPLDLFSDYTLTFSGSDYEIAMPNVYSTASFEEAYTYEGDDLGAVWSKEATAFRVWAPTATAVSVKLYEAGNDCEAYEVLPMTADVNGTWVVTAEGDLNGVYYTWLVTVDGNEVEACDPYARAVGVNGQRAMVIDLDSTDPEGWENDKDPHYDNNITDAVIYELHVRDLSVDENSGITNKGKFLGLIETGTTNPQGVPTGLDHIKNLGVTHIHLLPSYDYGSVDETNLDTPQFNWGYDPVNYNVPEGSYSTDPYNGEVRVKEFKQMVKGLHDNGISVIMDVVYNHVYNANDYCFNKIVPLYFSRVMDNGSFSSGSGCGNDTASERSMVKKYIVDSVVYWADEYHIDGFRFDLVGLIDTETINEIVEEVHKTHPNVIFYGEGWTMSTVVTKEGYTMTTQQNSAETPEFAFFSDTLRDALRGSVFDNYSRGYVSGGSGNSGAIARCFQAIPNWCKNPSQIVNYSSCHDNMTLFDRLVNSTPDATREEQIRMNNLAASIVLTSQGIPFIHAGEEMLRSKPLEEGGFDHNSYNSSDAVNNLKWNDLNDPEYQAVNAYYQGLIAFRKAHPALRLTTAEEVATYVSVLSGLPSNTNGFIIAAGANGEEYEFVVLFNPNKEAADFTLPAGDWDVYINDTAAGTEVLGTVTDTAQVAPISAMVLMRTPVAAEDTVPAETAAPTEPADNGGGSTGMPVAVIAALLCCGGGAVAAANSKKKKEAKKEDQE